MIDDRIKNSTVRSKFNNIKTIELQIAKRKLSFIGRVVRMGQSEMPGRLLSAWIGKKKTLKLSLLNDIKKIIPSIDQYGIFYTCAHIAYSELA